MRKIKCVKIENKRLSRRMHTLQCITHYVSAWVICCAGITFNTQFATCTPVNKISQPTGISRYPKDNSRLVSYRMNELRTE